MLINLSELFSCQGKVKTYTQSLEMEQFQGRTASMRLQKRNRWCLGLRIPGIRR